MIVCGGASESRLPIRRNLLRLSLGPNHGGNVKLGIEELHAAVAAKLPAPFVDLLELATYVYVADQAVKRGTSALSDRWRRRLVFRVPVRALKLWQGEAMQAALVRTLSFLSEDCYQFEFVAATGPKPVQNYLTGGATALEAPIEETCLFSGGLDSLGGAIEEAVVNGRRIALVTHQPTTKLLSRYSRLRLELQKRAKYRPLFVPVTINKDSSLSCETTQRSRSFLFLALGACVAECVGGSRVRFYENGVLSFNLPPCAQVVGAKATRTTHPRVLTGFAEILSLLAGRTYAVDNPFLWTTKTEVVQKIMAADCQDLIAFSTSCAHTWDKSLLHPHCGVCSQCIDRRFAVLAARAETFDPEADYKVGLLVQERDRRLDQAMLASYVEMANAVQRMSLATFFSHFGEVGRVLRHLGLPANDAGARVFDLYKRHATQVVGVMKAALTRYAAEVLARELPAYCLVGMMCDRAIVPPSSAATEGDATTVATATDRCVFRKSGPGIWEVQFCGGKVFPLFDSVGALYLHELLANPNKVITAANLVAMANGVSEKLFQG